MLPALAAEEMLGAAKAGALGAGTLEDSARRDLLRDLDRRINEPHAMKRKARRAGAAELSAMGIGARVAPKVEGETPSSNSEAVGRKDNV